MSWFSFLFNKEPYLLKMLSDNQGHISIHASRNHKPVAIRNAVSQLSRHELPAFIRDADTPVLALRPADWLPVRDMLMKQIKKLDAKKRKRLQMDIEQSIEMLSLCQMPSSFHIVYQWNVDHSALIGGLAEGIRSLGDNWFIRENQLWRINGVSEKEMNSLLKPIPINQLIYFMEGVLPVAQKRGLPITFPFTLEKEPAIVISIEDVKSDCIRIELKDRCSNPVILRGLNGFVFDGTVIRPTLETAVRDEWFPEGKVRTLEGEVIPSFVMKAFHEWKGFIHESDIQKLNIHIVHQKAEMVLEGGYQLINGVGEAFAVPKVKIAEQTVVAAELSRQIKSSTRFLRAADGWMPVDLLRELGIGPMGRMLNGQSLEKKYKLTPQDIIYRGSAQLQGPWSGLWLPELEWPSPGNVFNHFAFLSKWGINGGVLGGVASCAEELANFLEATLRNFPRVCMLIVGKKGVLETVREQWSSIPALWVTGNKKDPIIPAKWNGLLIVTPSVLANNQDLKTAGIDTLVMLEPDDLTKSNTTQVFRNLKEIRTRLRLAIYSDAGYLNNEWTRMAHMELINVSSTELERYVLLDPKHPQRALPKSYPMIKQKMTMLQSGDFTEVEWTREEKSVSIPPWESLTTRILSKGTNTSFQVTTSFESNETRFVKRAKELENHIESKSPFVPFMTYWPTYDSMTRDQSKWYFFWRNEVRHKRYPQTDLSYIFLYIYELINGIGWRDPFVGYTHLMEVWVAYRGAFSKLDHYLVDWMSDFVRVTRLNVPLNETLSQISSRYSGESWDMELLRRFREEPLALSYEAISSLSNYEISRSKFYMEGGQAVIEKVLPKVLTIVDAYLKKQQGMRLIELFNPGAPRQQERALFQSAVYDSSIYGETILLSVSDISRHEPLREFITQIVRAAENKLRELTGFKHRLRGTQFDSEIEILIGRYLEKEMGQEPQNAKSEPVIQIDELKLKQLIRESEAVQEMLTTEKEIIDRNNSSEEAPHENESRVRWERPVDAPDGLLTELQAVSDMLESISADQFSLLEVLAQNGWEKDESDLPIAMGGLMLALLIDELNQETLNHLGALLIVQEGRNIIVEEDYRDELEYLFVHREMLDKKQQAEMVWEIGETVEPSLQLLAARLKSYHLEVLFVLKNEKDSSAIHSIAERNGTMPELLLDEINDAAMEELGDLLIIDGTIAEEYLAMFDNLKAG